MASTAAVTSVVPRVYVPVATSCIVGRLGPLALGRGAHLRSGKSRPRPRQTVPFRESCPWQGFLWGEHNMCCRVHSRKIQSRIQKVQSRVICEMVPPAAGLRTDVMGIMSTIRKKNTHPQLGKTGAFVLAGPPAIKRMVRICLADPANQN